MGNGVTSRNGSPVAYYNTSKQHEASEKFKVHRERTLWPVKAAITSPVKGSSPDLFPLKLLHFWCDLRRTVPQLWATRMQESAFKPSISLSHSNRTSASYFGSAVLERVPSGLWGMFEHHSDPKDGISRPSSCQAGGLTSYSALTPMQFRNIDLAFTWSFQTKLGGT